MDARWTLARMESREGQSPGHKFLRSFRSQPGLEPKQARPALPWAWTVRKFGGQASDRGPKRQFQKTTTTNCFGQAGLKRSSPHSPRSAPCRRRSPPSGPSPGHSAPPGTGGLRSPKGKSWCPEPPLPTAHGGGGEHTKQNLEGKDAPRVQTLLAHGFWRGGGMARHRR